MSIYQILMPKLGESVVEGTISKILVSEGDEIQEDDLLVEITTAKVDSEIPSPVAGVVTKIYCDEDELLSAGTLLMDIRLEGEEDDEGSAADKETNTAIEDNTTISDDANEKQFLSPLVKKMMKDHGLSKEDLRSVKGSGVGGRIRKEDLLAYLETTSNTQTTTAPVEAPKVAAPKKEVSTPVSNSVTDSTALDGNVIEMGNTRKIIAQRMVDSLSTSAHVTTVVQADVTPLVEWRKRMNPGIKEKHQVSVSYLSIFVEIVSKALRSYPKLNSSIVGDKVVLKDEVNVGFAAATEDDDLFVPVVKNSDQLNTVGISKQVNKLIDKVRSKNLGIDEMTGGTFTLTNFGSFKGLFGTPIINQPEVAILALGNIEKVPAVIETEYGDVIGIRHKMYLSLSHDHRIIDGMLAGKFLQEIVKEIESFNPNVI
ncbi:2-oxo acid dehydrogenase subunit E2 [Halosquirtibacter xylanolyticus]|uniref:dihydrolipoamide acetyltransferase family protein n=1 Tax=Halosquirtibacter xylanolyticus TaxID=3374599 RepID=UPI0037493041|nr:2-oxo acid dehydrogenase subunit E2 [Prolixibacteraceae bacterium]